MITHLGLQYASIVTMITLKVLLAIMDPSNMKSYSLLRHLLPAKWTIGLIMPISIVLLKEDQIWENFRAYWAGCWLRTMHLLFVRETSAGVVEVFVAVSTFVGFYAGVLSGHVLLVRATRFVANFADSTLSYILEWVKFRNKNAFIKIEFLQEDNKMFETEYVSKNN